MALVELPNGDFIDPSTVLGVRPVVSDDLGPRVLIDVRTIAQIILVKFDSPASASEWARKFALLVNSDAAASRIPIIPAREP